MTVTNNEIYYKRMKAFLTHGITRDYKDREKNASHYYEMVDLGYNYRIPDLLCALGISQLKKIDSFIKKRQEIAKIYNENFKSFNKYLVPLTQQFESAYHIYVIKLNLKNLNVNRDVIFKALKAEGIGVNVHYIPIHLHPYYKNKLKTFEGMMPIAEKIYKQIITLPLFPLMNQEDINDVINSVKKVISYYKK